MMIKCKDDAAYKMLLEEMKTIASDDFYQYFLKNWDDCKQTWVQNYRSKCKTSFVNTNNFIEAWNRLAKRKLTSTNHLSKCIEILLELLEYHLSQQRMYIQKNEKISNNSRARQSKFITSLGTKCNSKAIEK